MGVLSSSTTQQDQSTGQSTFPLNRVVAFLGPFLAIFSGAVATWLVEHIPGLHTDKATLASNITAGIVFVIGAAGTFAMHHKWLAGWQQWEQSQAAITALASPDLMPDGQYDPAEFVAPLEGSDGQPQTSASVGGYGGDASNGGSAPPLSESPAVDMAADSSQPKVLPDAQQELASVPDANGEASAAPRPDTAVTPDVPTDELEPTEF